VSILGNMQPITGPYSYYLRYIAGVDLYAWFLQKLTLKSNPTAFMKLFLEAFTQNEKN